MYLAFGMVCAMLEASRSGKGQVIDAAMVDGVASLHTSICGMYAAGLLNDLRGENYYDSGCPWYDSYLTADGQYLSVGAIEARFYRTLVKLLGLDEAKLPKQHERARWPELRRHFETAFSTRSRAEWMELFRDHDVCVAPVLTLREAQQHPHLKARETFIEVGGVVQPAPAPRFSRTRPDVPAPPPEPGQHTTEVLAGWGFSEHEISELRGSGTIF